ncbi:glycoside hydrolase family 76 [Corynebacterium hindlerae]|uniref:Glycoside hydrolase family 76 n=1 Tax=Corynebacterium hindlerae TaxID=699041 RepID=A0A7G5FD32_9CORY|nr:glycoside hydrolase family 76 protein [Corynebacterium hindlerae]QMV84523.1 glycoside hydrolase family 76 [Corynebacterium hindlerae]
MQEKWSHRADLAEAAITDRHARKLWGIPRTNLGVVSWPPSTKDEFFVHWHYWWQAHYLDCQIDAALRRPTIQRKRRIKETMRGIRIRNIRGWTVNRYYDDKSWLALAVGRWHTSARNKALRALENNIVAGIDTLTGVLPWRTNETFYNVPTNGPAAIMMARSGRLAQACTLTDWVFDNLIDENGLVMDGMRMRMHGPELVRAIHPYCQGVMMGACLEIADRMLADQGVTDVASLDDAERAHDAYAYIARIRELVVAVENNLATPDGVINCLTTGGDGGLFKGILVRYLADVALRLPGDSAASRETKKKATRLVLQSATSLWNHRLEIDGLPVFPSDWTKDAQVPTTSTYRGSIGGAVLGSFVPERDLSVQLSGWMLLEAAAKVAGGSS